MAAMFSSLLRPRRERGRVEQSSNYSSPYGRSSPTAARRERMKQPVRYASADFTESSIDDDNIIEDAEGDMLDVEPREEEDEWAQNVNEDGGVEEPLLPIFSAAHLGMQRIV